MNDIIMRRIIAREAECKLKCLLETYSFQDEAKYMIMKSKIDEFTRWLWEESPIS